jgi:hypothetical protein
MTTDDDTLRALLLHQLPERDMTKHSERILLEEDFAERLQDVESDLLEDYARGRLTSEDRAAVERYLLVSTTQRERARTAHALGHLTRSPRSDRRLLLRWTVPTAALLAAGLAGIYLAPALVSQWIGPLDASATSTQNVTLLADSTRSRSIHTLHINPGASQIRLQLEITGASADKFYRLVIAGEAASPGLPDSPVQTLDHLAPSQSGPYRFVEVTMPVRMLARGSYRLTLTPAAPSQSPQDFYDWWLQIS